MSEPVLIVQGGAGGGFQDSRRPSQIRKKISRILKLAYEKLLKTKALEAVTYAVQLLEDDSEFNAGTGSQLQADGKARLSASIMDGSRLRFAAVINLEKIKNPILVARALLEEKDRILCGEGAFEFARKIGLKPSDPRTPQSIRRWKKWKAAHSPLTPTLSPKGRGEKRKRGEEAYDTVGACALDRFGNLASATSTGGRGFEWPGRVSDSAMPVANYAHKKCAISATGIGEEIIEEGLALKIATRVLDGLSLPQAFEKTFEEIKSRNRRIGAVGVDSKGKVTHTTTTEILIYGWQKGKRRGSSP